MLTHQSRSVGSSEGVRLNRTASISSQGHMETAARKGHRGSSPAIRTWSPDGAEASGVSPPRSPPLVYMGSRSPSPLQIRTSSLETKAEGRGLAELRMPSPSDPIGIRRGSRSISPLLIPPKSPTTWEGGTSPLSPLLGSLQVDLYEKKDTTLTLNPREDVVTLPGRLHFRLKYDLDKSDLHVHVIEAHDLSSRRLDSSGGSCDGSSGSRSTSSSVSTGAASCSSTSDDSSSTFRGFHDPYVRVSLCPPVDSRKRQTAVHRHDPNPFFDEHFKFPVSQEELRDRSILFQVLDYDRFTRVDVVGQVCMALNKYNVTTNLEVWAGLEKNAKPSGERQEILLSLSYLPSAQRLTVVVLQARNLLCPVNKEALDPFVKVYLLGAEGKRVKKKKTSARKGTVHPVWNEAVTFSIALSALTQAAIEVCVLDQSNDLMGADAVVGSCVVGPRETGTALAHWHDITHHLRKSVTQWHVLV